MPSSKKGRRTARTLVTLDVVVMKKFRSECLEFLNEGQAMELADLVDRLEDFGNQRLTWDLEIVRDRNFWKLTHSGTSLGRIEADVYFAHIPERGEVVVLGASRSNQQLRKSNLHERLANRLDHYLRITK